MVDKKRSKNRSAKPIEVELAPTDPPEAKIPEFIFDKRTGEMTLIDPSGEKATLRTTVIEDENRLPDPMTVEEFAAALAQLDKLGLTWTADNPPIVRAKEKKFEGSFAKEEFFLLQKNFPQFPREVGIVVFFALMGSSTLYQLVGGKEILEKKASLVRKFIINGKFRSEFFFKHAIKVPYLANLDWEVVFKLREQGVSDSPSVSYGIVSLLLREPSYFGIASERKAITVAVNEELVDKFIKAFKELKEALRSVDKLTIDIETGEKSSRDK